MSANVNQWPAVVGQYFQVGPKIGEGSFSVVFKGTDKLNNQTVAIKFEPRKSDAPQLRDEWRSYRMLAGSPGVPHVYHFGAEGLHNVLVIDLLGPNLEDLFDMCGRRFTLKTVCLAARQMITRVQAVHEKHLIYRDIKPDNFLIGLPGTRTANVIHMIDFGMAKLWRDPKTKQHIPYRERKSLSGTARYMSINTHLGREQSRRDDLEGLGHVFLYFLRGGLPWQGLKAATNKQKYEKIGEKKQTTPVAELCAGFPEETAIYMNYVRKLGFEETPDYDFMRELFTKMLKDAGEDDDGVMDWMLLNGRKRCEASTGHKFSFPASQNKIFHCDHHRSEQGHSSEPDTLLRSADEVNNQTTLVAPINIAEYDQNSNSQVNSDGQIDSNNKGSTEDPSPELNLNVLESTSLKSMRKDEQTNLLHNVGYLFGVCIDRTDGPIRSMRPVAKRSSGNLPCVREMNDIITELITTKNEREANYVHQGWSLPTASLIFPWTASRISRYNQSNRDEVWITKRTIMRRLTFRVLLEDLIPDPGFEADIKVALEKPTTYDRFQGVYRALHNWGDVVPLEFDVGLSLTLTSTETNLDQLTNSGAHDCAKDLSGIKAARLAKQGGDMTIQDWNDEKFFATSIPPLQWCQVRVISVAHTTDLLDSKLRKQLSALLAQRLSYCPPMIFKPLDGYKSYDDIRHASNTISSVIVRSQIQIDCLSIAYVGNEMSNKHGGAGGWLHEFTLMTGEYITDMMVWSDSDWVYGLQFFTNMGRASPHYGGFGGTPRAANSKGGVLVGFSSVLRSRWNNDMLSRVQGIWCHDRCDARFGRNEMFSEYIGGEGGTSFSDRIVVGDSRTMYISKVHVGCGDVVDSIQFTYGDEEKSQTFQCESACHGGKGGEKKQFALEPGENIITVSGRYDETRITQLCFTTNLGRMSDVFGGGRGRDFSVSAPQDVEGKCMRLHYTCGKSEEFVNGILFVWTPL